MFGSNVTIVDSDFHGIGPEDRRNPDKVKTKSVIVGNNVFVGNGAFILKGVTIGDNSVIGAGSVVAMDIPPNCVAAGNPVRVIKQIYNNNANQEE